MSLDSLEVPQNYKELVPVCQNLDEVLKSTTFRYIFILSLKGSWVGNEDIKRAINTASKLWLGNSISEDDLFHLRLLLKTHKLLEAWQELFSGLQFTWVDSLARKKLRELFSIEAGHGDGTARSIAFQILVKIYNALSVNSLQSINDSEVEKEYRFFSWDHPLIQSYLMRKYQITENDCRIAYDYQRGCFLGYFYDIQGNLYWIDEMWPTRISNIIFLWEDSDASNDSIGQREYWDKIQHYIYQRFWIDIHRIPMKKLK
jgi:hypothetical protein